MLLVGSAIIEELRPFLAAGDFQAAGNGLYRHRYRELVAAALGVGALDCALGLAPLLAEVAPQKAVFTGSCGVYSGALAEYPLGSLVAPSRVRFGDFGEACGHSYFPACQVLTIDLDPELNSGLDAGGDGLCLALNAITADYAAAVKLQNFYSASFEQMEAYGFARACSEAGTRAALLLAVVNEVGPQGHRQWLANFPVAAEDCARHLWERIDTL